jgi:hypothetical protein
VPADWTDVSFLQWLIRHQCDRFGKRIERTIVPHLVTSIQCPPMKPPFVRDVSSLLDRPQLIARESSGTGHHLSFTDNIIDRLSSQPAFGCLLVNDLSPFGHSIDRLRLFFKEYGKPIVCIYTEENTKIKRITRSPKKWSFHIPADDDPTCIVSEGSTGLLATSIVYDASYKSRHHYPSLPSHRC